MVDASAQPKVRIAGIDLKNLLAIIYSTQLCIVAFSSRSWVLWLLSGQNFTLLFSSWRGGNKDACSVDIAALNTKEGK